jgi:hypothetical protein
MPAVGAEQAAPQAQVTFTKDIAPILQRSCENCHHAGGSGPMPLSSYEDVRPWARAIKLRTSLREMPPWFIEKNVGIQKFKDDPSLIDEEIAKIAAWADNGGPRGNPADMPPPRQFADTTEWRIGKPDLIISSPVRTVQAVGADFQGDVTPTPVGLTEDRFVKAVEVREVRVQEAKAEGTAASPRAALSYSVIHHAIISARTELGADDDSPVGFRADNFTVAHEAGQNATIYPDELGVRLPAGSFLTWELHTHSFGKEALVRLDIAFKLHPKGYKPKYVVTELGGGGAASLANHDLDIPAGEDNARFDALIVLRKPTKLVTFEPHMHAGGKRMCVQATYPNGAVETLNCSRYNHNWVKVYSYADDVAPLLPAFTVLHVIGWYDNSSKNPRNAEPRNWKGFGNRSIEDMMFFLGRQVTLTEEQFKEEVAQRQVNQRLPKTTAQNNSR